MTLPEASSNPASASAPLTTTVVPSSSKDRFVDRRNPSETDSRRLERRQFGSSHAELSDDGRELALAIDRYKVAHHRRYLTCDEMLMVLSKLGYAKES